MEASLLSGIFHRLVQKHRVPGAQLTLYRNGKMAECVVGVESLRTGRPVTTESAFPYGSITKFYTAALAMQFVSDGDLDLDEPLADLVPELKRAANRTLGTATVRQLLSHTAGLADNIDCPDMRGASYQRYAAACGEVPSLFMPGLAFSYSNAGYCLMGRVIEYASGMDWWTALESCLLHPLGVEPAFLHDPRPDTAHRRTTDGHAVRLDVSAAQSGTASGKAGSADAGGVEGVETVDHLIPLSTAAAGALAGSATALVAAARLHLDDRDALATEELPDLPDILSKDAVEEMRECVPGAEPYGLADGWGLGLMTHRGADGAIWLGHDGAVGGSSCHLRLHPASNVALAMTANATTGQKLWDDLLADLRAEGLDIGHYTLPHPDTPRVEDPAEYVGEYANGDLVLVVVADASGRLFLTRKDYFDSRLVIHEDDRFVASDTEVDAVPVVGRFVRGRAGGPITLLQYGGRALARC
ncbi:serine hydrolase domain-containing protein [Streptomyces sp. NL15-2K]|uniref:serine hydrolase domain-containing protein n=1 Tax=Streptomyces sp. NL15-2K TaxID=376149 RepID=UPI000F5855D1|nr:serine hydrolase domain-containing protein [Kutzneria buriramensis]WKX14163.1 serine hydrolase domain-containing protein [Kutzneria buriramensis]GCB44679.1 beta-lactamase [Streptomyces sp. NL15-2K]